MASGPNRRPGSSTRWMPGRHPLDRQPPENPPTMTRLSNYLLPTLKDAPGRRRGHVAQADGQGGARSASSAPGSGPGCPPAIAASRRSRRIIREEMDAIGCHEMLMPVLQPAEPWRKTGPLRDRRAVQAARPQGLRDGAGDDQRGGGHLPRRQGRPLLPGPAVDALSPADQGARRAAAARRDPADPRVHDEGRLLVRSRRGRPGPQLRAPGGSLRAHLRALRPALVCGRIRRRDDGRLRGPRVHGPLRSRRERGRARPRIRGERRGGERPAAAGRASAGDGRAPRGSDARS